MSRPQPTILAHPLPSADQADLFERPLADAADGGMTHATASVRADGWHSPALPATYRYGDRPAYPQPHGYPGRAGYGPYGAARQPGYPKVYG
ncbi:hypothetical protein [Asticcacaulis sp. AC402]|uniref:hypothetical protein n=1 Tax=Asticcacaulis sp. AC402 TaxID=1282361 RepID=UPI0003C3DE3F|nr:hypothetical protein [Asticcacaulis sp. AC402]ESQ75055.1 hypothetical protein ABAC402_11665 [Asticcacaulis sp. AC402]